MSVIADLRLGLRNLIRNPGFTAVAITMLAVGIGLNATVFTVTDAVLFKGFAGVTRNDQLVYISNGGCCVPYPDFLEYRAQAKSFQGMAIVHGIGFVLSDADGYAENVFSNENSADTFRVVGAKPILGRDFEHADEIDGAPNVGIVSYGFWERRFAKDPAVIGRVVRKNGAPMTIVGVMPKGFSFPQNTDVWVPLVQTPEVLKRENSDTWCIVARLGEGATIQTARAEIETIAKRLAAAHPLGEREFWPKVGYFHEFFIGPNATLIYGSMWGAVGFVLLIACANLANLLLARALGRSREISVRIALGAGRWRIIRQLLIESVMLSGLGGLLGWWIAKWGVHAYELAMFAKSSWLILDYSMDSRVLWYLIAISAGTGVLFGLTPALRLSKLDINVQLKDGGRGATIGARGKHLSAVLVAAEMALAVVLLAGAGVMIRSYLKIHSADMGIDVANLLGASMNLPAARYPRPADRISFYDRLTARLASMPGVESVATAENLPTWGSAKVPYEVAGVPSAGEHPKISVLAISPTYFQTLKASLLSGREFNQADDSSGVPVVIVNQLLAKQFWPGEDPVGKRIRFFDGQGSPMPWRTVVGVASNIIQNDVNRQRMDPVMYLPYRQKPEGGEWIVVRTRIPSGSLAAAFRSEVKALDPDLPVYGPMTIADRMERFWDSRFYGGLFLIFAAIALLLASIGLYTLVAHSVSQRTQEIGVRMAIGATGPDILELVLKRGLAPLAIGLIIGLAGSLALNRLLSSMLIQISPADPLALAVACGVLVLAAVLGCLIPARRAMQIDPVNALKHE